MEPVRLMQKKPVLGSVVLLFVCFFKSTNSCGFVSLWCFTSVLFISKKILPLGASCTHQHSYGPALGVDTNVVLGFGISGC